MTNPPVQQTARKRRVVFERVRMDPAAEWFADEHGNLFGDRTLLRPLGLVVCRVRTVIEDD